jgi:hypothetical protein
MLIQAYPLPQLTLGLAALYVLGKSAVYARAAQPKSDKSAVAAP